MSPEKYKATRIRLGYNQGELAEALGIPREAVVRREAGTQRITEEAAIALGKAIPPEKQTTAAAQHTLEHIGSVPVDSGALCIVDPCYLTPSAGNRQIEDADRLKDGDFVFADSHGTGHIFSGFGGDGSYPIYALKRNGRTRAVLVDFDGRTRAALAAHAELVAALEAEIPHMEMQLRSLESEAGTENERAWRSNEWAHLHARLEKARAALAKAKGQS